MKNCDIKYFLAANSASGFISEFSSNCTTEYKTYIIKGGPGCGKSSFMKKVAKTAENSGEKVVFCPCSSDPDSLDAVIFEDKKIIILDGTAPHTVDPVYPAVCEEILNFGQFWDSQKIADKNEVIRVTNLNKTLHKTASCYISAAGSLLWDNFKTAESCTDLKKVERFAKNLCQKLIPQKSGSGEETVRFLGGKTPKGLVSFPETITTSCQNIVIIKDEFYSVSSQILKIVRDFAIKNGYKISTIKNPLFPNLIDHIILPELSLAIVTENRFIRFQSDRRRIHSRRFIDNRLLHFSKNRIKFNLKASKELLDSAYFTLKEAKAVHDELESHYIKAMDFEKLNDFADMLCKNLF